MACIMFFSCNVKSLIADLCITQDKLSYQMAISSKGREPTSSSREVMSQLLSLEDSSHTNPPGQQECIQALTK